MRRLNAREENMFTTNWIVAAYKNKSDESFFATRTWCLRNRESFNKHLMIQKVMDTQCSYQDLYIMHINKESLVISKLIIKTKARRRRIIELPISAWSPITTTYCFTNNRRIWVLSSKIYYGWTKIKPKSGNICPKHQSFMRRRIKEEEKGSSELHQEIRRYQQRDQRWTWTYKRSSQQLLNSKIKSKGT